MEYLYKLIKWFKLIILNDVINFLYNLKKENFVLILYFLLIDFKFGNFEKVNIVYNVLFV